MFRTQGAPSMPMSEPQCRGQGDIKASQSRSDRVTQKSLAFHSADRTRVLSVGAKGVFDQSLGATDAAAT